MMRSLWWVLVGLAVCACAPLKDVKQVVAGTEDRDALAVTVEFPADTPHIVLADRLATQLRKCWATSQPTGGGNVYIDQQFRNAQVIEFTATRISDFARKTKNAASGQKPFATITVVSLADTRSMVTLVDVGGPRPLTIDSVNQIRWWTQGRVYCTLNQKKPAEITLDAPIISEARYIDIVRELAVKSACDIKGNISLATLPDGIRGYSVPCVGRLLKLRCRFDPYTRLNDWGVPFTYDPKSMKDSPACEEDRR